MDDVPPFAADERRGLADLTGRGLAMAARIGGNGLVLPEGTMEGADLRATKRFVCRRWVFDTLLLLEKGERSFNGIRHALGSLAGESLSAQLAPLVAAGLLERRIITGSPLRVAYALTVPGRRVALGVHVMALGHVENARGVLAPEEPRVVAGPPGSADLDGYLRVAARVVAARQQAHGEAKELDAARRFARLCMRRWHIDIMGVLLAGPARFREIKRAVGAGDEAIALALRNLGTLRCVAKDGQRGYLIEPRGVVLMGLGVPLVVLAWQAGRSSSPALQALSQ
ncbi:MAG: winged helix-turn-helix transcriptional regulator [Halobacteriales archaeon]|nr:winged helix-turn-helix transcriptional regulator [Halobacteriales archaeon]